MRTEGDDPARFAYARRERRDAAEHRRRILAVAHHLFALHGVAAVSMSQIAKDALVGQGTLYRRYRNKGELCMDVMRERHECFVHEVAEGQHELATSPALERLDDLVTKSVGFLEEHSPLLGPSAGSLACSMPHDRQEPAPFYAWLGTLVTSLLTEAVKAGELAPLDIPYTVDALLACLNPNVYQFQRQERGFTPERITAGLRRIYHTGARDAAGEIAPY